jgi:plasmid maintenance system antidote protein VapI
MYQWKYDALCIRKQKKASEIIGVTPQYLSKICGKKAQIKKLLAYCIVKYINSEAEIEDYFERIK